MKTVNVVRHSRDLARIGNVTRSAREISNVIVAMSAEEHCGEAGRDHITEGQVEDYAVCLYCWLIGDTDFTPTWSAYPHHRLDNLPESSLLERVYAVACNIVDVDGTNTAGRGQRSSRRIIFRATKDELAELDELATHIGKSRSATIRVAIAGMARSVLHSYTFAEYCETATHNIGLYRGPKPGWAVRNDLLVWLEKHALDSQTWKQVDAGEELVNPRSNLWAVVVSEDKGFPQQPLLVIPIRPVRS